METLIIKMNLEELQTFRETIDYAINIAKEAEETKCRLSKIDGSEKIIDFFITPHPLTNYYNVNGKVRKVGILPILSSKL